MKEREDTSTGEVGPSIDGTGTGRSGQVFSGLGKEHTSHQQTKVEFDLYPWIYLLYGTRKFAVSI
ncbi:hypothetical protein N7486_009340 [Penicillium sp. IBT 16267x]|nr:hypothetical protein N7486_009340 [Penicillium sp. IBT 16267x]